jgi:molybdopterin-guanine dinucleotide biosynthesis protein A
MRRELAVDILAGGEGRRIGGDKPLLRLGEDRLVDRALRNARGWSECVAISARSPAQVEPIDAPIIIDEPDIAGPLAGLVAALRFTATCRYETLITIPVDMPFLPSDLADRLDSEIGHSGCAVASSGGHAHPVCALWRTSVLERVGDYLAGKRRSLMGFALMIGCREVDWPSDPFDPFFNINTADGLAVAERRGAN